MYRAHEESQVKSMRVSLAWAAKRARISERKLTGRCPAWLRLLPDGMAFEIIKGRDEVVRTIFN